MLIKKNEILIIGSEGSIGSKISEKLTKDKLDPILIDAKKSKKKNFFYAKLKNSNQIEKLFNKILRSHPKIKVLINCCGYIHSELSYNFLTNKIHNEEKLKKNIS